MTEKKEKKRLDVLVVEHGYAESREKAKGIIMAGLVYVDNQKADKPGAEYPVQAAIEYRGEKQKNVIASSSRGLTRDMGRETCVKDAR